MQRISASASNLSRRAALLLGASGIAFAALGGRAQANPWERLEAARNLLAGDEPSTDGLSLELPLVSEDGSSVPLTVRAESPMTADDYIESIHLFAARNPSPEIAEFRFTPRSGRAQVQTRVRLNETQNVIAIARTSKNAMLATSREVRVTTSGCLVPVDMFKAEDEMRARVRVPERVRPGTPGEVLTLINHPMETGLREDTTGKILPQRIIRSFVAELDGEPFFQARLYRSLAANPYLRFFVAPEAGGELVFKWTEDTGRVAEEAAKITVG